MHGKNHFAERSKNIVRGLNRIWQYFCYEPSK